MDQMQKEESQASCWDKLFLVERNSQKPSPSGEAADHKTNIPSPDLKPSHLNLLTTFGLSIEDLEELSHYPDDQLTPENMPVLFLAIQKRKLASKGPPLPLKSTEKATISTADGLNPTVEKTVIDYRHKSKYGYNEGPKEGNASSIAKDMSMEGCPTQQPESVPAMASSVISSPKNPTKELMRQAGSQASAPNLQASLLVAPAEKAPLAEHGVSAGVPSMMLPVVPPVPPSVMPPALPSNLMEAMNQRLPPFTPEQVEFLSRHCRYEHAPRADPPNCLYQTMGGQKTFRKAPEDPVKSPFGTVKASWLPDFSQTDKQKEKKLPTAPQMCDYYSVTPRIFPHLCSLCNKDCLDKDWTQHLNSLQHKENCRWLLWQYPDWTPKIPTSPKRYEDDRQERNESRQRSASPSPKRSRRSSSGHARHWSRSRSRSSGRYRTSRPRSRSPRCLPSPRHQSRTRSNSPRESLHSSRRSRSRSSGHHRTSRLRSPSPRHLPSPRHQSRSPWRSSHSSRRSRSRSSGCHRTSQPRSRSPRCLPSPRHRSRTRSRSPWQSSHSSRRSRSRSSGYHRTNQPRSHSSRQPSRSPQQSLPSGRWSQSSSSKERRSESSTKSTEDRYAKKPGSQKRSDERQRTHRSSGCREKGHEDLERTRQETPKQKLSANETGNQKQTRDKLVPGQSCEELERSALASLTEKSILQAMAQLQAHRTADGTLNQEPNSADLISVIQQVATQVITTVLDSREASTTQASTSVRDSASNKLNSVARKAKTQSVKMDSSLRQGTANTTKAERKSLGSPCPKKGTSLNSKAKAKNKAGLCPEKSSKAMAECADSPCIQQGTAASGKNEAPHAVAQEPGQGIASSSKAVNGSMVDLSPHADTAVCSRNQDEAGCSLNEGTAGNSEAERLPVTDPVPSQGTVAGGKTENKCQGDPGSQQGIDPNSQARSQDTEMELAPGSVCPYSGEATVSIKAETSGLAHPSPQTATSGPCKAKIRGVKQKLVAGSVPPQPGEAAVSSQSVNSKAEISGVSQPQAASPGPSKAKKRGVKQKPVAGSSPRPGETAVNSKPVSRSKAETSGLAGPSPQTATSGICKARNQGVKQKPVARSVPPCPGEAAVSSQTINSTKAETSPVAGQSPQPEKTPGPCKAKNQDEEQKVVAGSASFCSGEVAVSPQTVSSKLDTSGVARPSPQSATSGPCKAKTHDVQQKPVLGREAVVSSQLMNSKAETSEVAGPSPQPGASKNQDVKQKFVAGHVPPGHGDGAASTQPVSIRAETSEMAGPNSQLGTSGPCNAENRDVVAGNIPDLFKPAAKPRVWVCGGSLVVSAQKWDLQKRQFGQLDWLQQNITLEWHGQEDLTWAQLVATVQKLAAQGQAPDVLILHLGEKDLLSTPWPALSQTIRREVGLLKEAFPKVRLMWSEMLPQNIRPAGMEACNVEELLREANLVVGGFISGLGGMVIKHGEIANCVFTLNLEGGGLSYIGLDLFLEDIRNAVRAHVLQSSGAAGGGLQGGRNASPFASLAASAGLGTMSQEAAIEGNQTVSSSKEASQTPTNTGRSAVSSQLASWVSHRKEMQTVGQKHMVGKFRFCSRSSDRPGSSSKPRLWICGDAMVISAQKRASSTAAGSQLGLEQRAVLEWHGQEKLKWIQLLPFLHNLVTWHQAPDVLIIHFGDEDLARAFDHNLSDRVIRELVLLKTLFPSIPLIWSGIIPRSSWHEKRADMIRTAVHKVVGGSVRRHGGHVIEHLRISSKDPKLHLDEANLSHAGLDIFLEDIRSGILTYMLKCSRRTGDGLKEGMSLPPPSSPATPSGLPFGSRESVTQEDEVVSSSEDASRMQTSAGEAPVSSKAETSGVGCPSPQPGTSGTFRTENRDVEQNLVFGNVSLCSGSAGHLSKPRIWLCGHSLVNAAQERAFATSTGFQLGLDERIVLEWHGWYGLTWAQLIPYLQDLATWLQPPDVLILHLGESDIMFTIYIGFLIETIQRELFLVKELFPNVKVVWSEMMPWGNWLELPSASSKKESLRKVNLDVGQYVKDHGGAVVKHPRISFEDLELYTCQAKLSDAGLDIFLEDIKHGILAHLVQSGGAARKEFEEGTRLSPSASPAAPTSLSSMSGEITREDEAVSSTKEVSGMQISTRATAVSPQPVSNKAETSYVASPSSQPGTFGAFRTENQDVEQQTLAFQSIPPCLGEAAMSSQPVSGKADTSDASGPGPQSGMPGASKVKHQNEDQKPVTESFVPCTGEGAVSSAPVSIKAESSEVAIPSPQPGTSRPCKVENQDEEQKLVAGSASPCPGEGAVSSPPVKIKAETSEVAVPSPQPGTSGPCKVENQDEEQKLVAGSASPSPGEGAVSSPPVSIKAESSEVAIPSPQPGTSRPCKVENQDEEQKLVAGNAFPCPGEGAVSSPPVSIKAETSEVAIPSPQPGTSRPCKVENRDEEQKLVAGSASPCPGEGAVSSPPVSIKAETSEVAIPSPQPGTSGPCKVENQELVAGSVSPCPKQEAPRWRVWVCGHSVVVSAEQQASGTGAGPQLGLEGDVVLEWHGQEDLTWTRLVPTLQSLAAQGQAPDVLIIHLGEKDLESHRGAHLSGTIRKELVLVKDLFPQVRILWSNLLLRRRGAGRTGSRMANRARTMVNLEVGSFIGTLGGAVLEHGAIPHTDPDFYVDGDSLSRRGLDVFLEDVKNGILAHLPS
ncbi:uncharacterized protein LOC143819563 isoform X3 [Paroedura picta]|uniref:uncharacterized protein LOC143819563 isoform X3 n=1 Tax=Paroedura picta TaxID=143630 RepID=UPI0040570106